MKTLLLSLAAAGAVLIAPAAQATIFNFDLVYWEDSASPPADPDASEIAHFVVDDQFGGKDYHGGDPTGIWTYGNFGSYFGLPFQNSFIDVYNDYWGGGFTFTPYTVIDGLNEPDYDYMLDFAGPSALGGLPEAYFIRTGVYDYDFSPGTLRVTITQTAEGSVPEPASWAMMLGGFGLVGAALRQRRRVAVSFG